MSEIGNVADVPEQSRFEIRVDGEVAGFTEYRRRPGLIAFVHTLIDPRVRAYIGGHTEYLDLVPEDMRAKFDLPADA